MSDDTTPAPMVSDLLGRRLAETIHDLDVTIDHTERWDQTPEPDRRTYVRLAVELVRRGVFRPGADVLDEAGRLEVTVEDDDDPEGTPVEGALWEKEGAGGLPAWAYAWWPTVEDVADIGPGMPGELLPGAIITDEQRAFVNRRIAEGWMPQRLRP